MATESLTEQAAYEIGLEAYHYLYPLILMDLTRLSQTNCEAGTKLGSGPMNEFHHLRAFPPADFREVVRPNFDTLYSSAWLDLTQEPVILSVPDTAGRYYLLPILDMWSDVFAVPGKRTSGTQAGDYAIVPRGWAGSLPSGVARIESPTAYAWIIGRTQTNGVKDYPAVHQVQDGYGLTRLSHWGQTQTIELPATPIDPTVDMETPPPRQVNAMPAAKYFSYGAELMKLHAPHITDWSLIARLKQIGIELGQSFDFDQAPPAVQAGLERAKVDGLKLMYDKVPTLARVVKGWQMNTDTMGVYGNYYLKRAIVALVGLGANQPEDAVYPFNTADADGNMMDGASRYVLHFDRDELPPVEAFWSVTMYDSEGFPVANPLNRLAIGDRDALQYNADGSLDLYIQHESPGPDRESNWLPAPSQGEWGVTMRLYAPKAQILDGRWTPPAIVRVG